MRILFYSNAPWVRTGYGNQADLFARHLNNLGHKIAIACNHGLMGARIESPDGVIYYPAVSTNSNEIVQAHADDFNADVIISLYDVWPLKFERLKTPWVAWAPVDHDPAPPEVIAALIGRPDEATGKTTCPPATGVVAYSKFGQVKFQEAGIDAAYIPHGIDTSLFKRLDKLECRARLGLPADQFVVGMVGTNKFFPSRKCIPQVLQAFSLFEREHRGAILVLHTEETGRIHGVRLKTILKSLGLGEYAIRVCDQYQYAVGHDPEYMINLYNAIDVLINPSMGEGFGIPIMEAQACGTPVIANNFTAMGELVAGGWLLGHDQLERFWTAQNSWQVIPQEKPLAALIENAYQCKVNQPDIFELRRDSARRFAEGYDFEKCVAPAWDAYLRGLKLGG